MLSFSSRPDSPLAQSDTYLSSPQKAGSGLSVSSWAPQAGLLPDTVRQKLDSLVRTYAEKGQCRITLKVTDPAGDSHFAGYDGRVGMEINEFDQAFEIGSCSKLFTATSILQLVEQQKLSLEDKLPDLLDRPDLLEGLMVTDSADYLGEVRLENLLNHTSGLPEYFLDSDEEEIGLFGDSTLRFTPAQLVGMAKRLHKPQFRPGEKFKYTNTNYILLGMILEQHTSLPFQEYIRENILEKAGLEHTYFPSTEKIGQRAPGHWKGTPSQMPATLAGAAGEIVSTLDDMDLFVRAWARGDFFGSHSTMEELRGSHYNPMGSGIQYGLGVVDLFGTLGHAGQTFGFQSYMGSLPNGSSFAFGIDDANESAWNLAIILGELLKTP